MPELVIDPNARLAWFAEPDAELEPIRDQLRKLGCRWHKQRWELPLQYTRIARILGVLGESHIAITATAETQLHYRRASYRHTFLRRLRERNPPTAFAGHHTYKTRPHDHQLIGTEWLIRSVTAMLLDEPGLGKTKQSIDAADYLIDKELVTKPVVVVVCPNTVKHTWAAEIEKHSCLPHTTLIPSGVTETRRRQISAALNNPSRPTWIILNYESLRCFAGTFRGASNNAILILDEAHRLKNPSAKVTKIVTSSTPARLWLLTGTPIANHLEDVWSLMNLVACPFHLLGQPILAARWAIYVGVRDRDRHSSPVGRSENPSACGSPRAVNWETASPSQWSARTRENFC